MSGWEERKLLEDLLASGMDDWVSVAEVYGIAARATSDPFDRRAVSVGLIASVLLSNQMEAGVTVEGEGYVPWDLTPAESILRIASEWMARADVNLYPGEIAWLRNLPVGDLVGRAVLDREAI